MDEEEIELLIDMCDILYGEDEDIDDDFEFDEE